jgi:hypothetical protein
MTMSEKVAPIKTMLVGVNRELGDLGNSSHYDWNENI